MGGGSLAKEHPREYLFASAGAAAINYPLWRASAIGQSGFTVHPVEFNFNIMMLQRRLRVPPSLSAYMYAFAPPYKGLVTTVLGMTWARAAIFWGSDYGRDLLREHKLCSDAVATILPPLIVSTLVQCVNQPIVRATITLQNPSTNLQTATQAIRHIYQKHGIWGLWHGTSAGILKTVPKYCSAVIVKDVMEEILEKPDPTSANYRQQYLVRSAMKSSIAGIAGAALTNPLDVIRNEMFKTNQTLTNTVRNLYQEMGWRFIYRGMTKNMIAVAIPVGCTIFFTDVLIQVSSTSP